MSTSLSEQLQRLAVPQTSILVDERRRASILFDSKDAATKNRRTVFDLGYSGLQELIAINSGFQQFEATLFNESTLELERSVELGEVNKLLDKNIRKFLQHLSPYFMLRPAHLCIEWLLRRFHIHEYNKQEFLELMLPYHETNIFIKCLQTIRIKHSDAEFNWLKCLQKPGVALSKTAIINRAATQPAFLKFVCQATICAIKELGTRAHLLQAQINFYVSVVSGALNTAPAVQEWHIVTILPSLLKAFASDVVDFVSAGFIVVSQLVARTQLKLKLLDGLIAKVGDIRFEQMRNASILLLIWIFDTQANMCPKFKQETLLKLVQYKWLTGILSTLAKEGVAVHFICVPLVNSAVREIQRENEAADIFKLFMERLLYDVDFPNATAMEIINSFLDSYIAPHHQPNTSQSKSQKVVSDDKVINLDSDDDMGETDGKPEDVHFWYSDYLKKLEHQYPTAFDKTIKEALNSNIPKASNRSKAIKMAIRYRLKSLDADSTDIYENLYHHTAKIRLYAMQTLIANFKNYKAKSRNYELLKECLADRIMDDSELVVSEVLQLPTSAFVDILGHAQFVEALFRILHKTTDNDNPNWAKVALPVVQHLTTQDIVEHYDNNLILLALMPFIFPTKSSTEVYVNINAILTSPFTENIKFLKVLKTPGKNIGSEFSATEFKRQFLDLISHSKKTPKVLEFLKSVQSQPADYFSKPTRLVHFLLLITAFMKQNFDGDEALLVFKTVYGYCKHFGIKHMDNQEWQHLDKHNFIPLQLFSDFLSTLTRHTKFENLQSWEQSSGYLEFCLRILQLASKEAFANEQPQEKLEWSKILKEFLSIVFEDTQDKFKFLLNFYVYEEVVLVDNYAELRVRAFILSNSMLRNKQNKLSVTAESILKVLVALSSHHETLRIQAMVTLKCMLDMGTLQTNLLQFVEQVLGRKEEISMDHEQFPLVLYTILNPIQKLNVKKEQVSKLFLAQIMEALKVHEGSILEDIVFKAELLRMIKHINDEQLLADLLPLSLIVLEKHTSGNSDLNDVKLLRTPFSIIFQLICERFDSQSIENILVDYPIAWHLFEKVFSSYDVFLMIQEKLTAVPCVLLTALDEHTFEKMPSKYQLGLIKLIINCVAVSENDSILQAANKLLRHCTLDCKPLASILNEMCKKCLGDDAAKRPTRKSTTISCGKQQLQLKTLAWREGEIFLELLENKKKLTCTDSLIPALFELLKLCLDLEEQSAVEYVKQLTLSALLHCCQQAKVDGIDLEATMPKTTFRIDQIVQCLRATPNPQTHHNALLLLSHCASLFPQQVLLNIVDIFTFMGSSVVRHEDAFSFHLINHTIEILLPILVDAKSQKGKAVIPVLKVFSDIMLDVPEHRRIPLYTKFMYTLNVEQYLWMFLCVVFEQHVIDDEKQRLLQKKGSIAERKLNDKLSKRLIIAHNLTNAFSPQISIQTCIELVNYVKHLPYNKKTADCGRTATPESVELNLFDVKLRTDIQLRHYKYVIMQFLSTFTSSPEFLQQIGLLTDTELVLLKPYYQSFIIQILSYVPIVNAAIDKCGDSPQTRYWKVILHHAHDLLDNAISLLSPEMFLVVVHGLMQHQLLSIRKKVIELLISKLQQRDGYFHACSDEYFMNLLKPLSDIVGGILQKHETHSGDLNILQQTALIAIKLLSKQFALKHIGVFKAILASITKIIKKRRQISKLILATAILTVVEIASNLKANSLAQLPKFMPQLVEVLTDQVDFVRQNGPDNTTLAITTGLQKLMESLPLFLGPYIVDIIAALSAISTSIESYQLDKNKDQRSGLVLNKIAAIWRKIAMEIPARILVPSVDKAYNELYTAKDYANIGMLMRLLLESISRSSITDLTNIQTELCNFLMFAIEFRVQICSTKNYDLINTIEASILDVFVAWVLKLSENSFRPIYYKLYDWALKGESIEKALTFFLLSSKIAEQLKSLFVLFAHEILQDAASLLNKQNTSKGDIKLKSEFICVELLKSILNTLYNIFLYDSKGFINTQRFEILMQPIVDQLENRLVLENEELQHILSSCIAQLAVAVSSDIMWKQLNEQVLLKTRANVPEVRILSFNCCVEIARKLGDDFTTLLPETVPFIAELFEDENERVEKSTRKSIQELERILGESLQKYL